MLIVNNKKTQLTRRPTSTGIDLAFLLLTLIHPSHKVSVFIVDLEQL